MRFIFLLSFVLIFFSSAVTAYSSDNGSRYIEFSFGAGATGNIDLALGGAITQKYNIIPYGKLHMRLFDGMAFVPEISISDSGIFNFDRKGIVANKNNPGYGEYYIKIPLMFTIPFFSYDSMFNIDAMYMTYITTAKVSKRSLINNNYVDVGNKLSMTSSTMQFRIFLDTPIVLDPSIFQYSYFGVFYSEDYTPRTVTSPAGIVGADMLVNTLTRSGGIFYDMKKDTPVKGLNFNISLQLGYGGAYIPDSTSVITRDFSNLLHLLIFNAKAGISYRYEFSNKLGVMLDVSGMYRSVNQFFVTPATDTYRVDMGGSVIYAVTLSFIFGY